MTITGAIESVKTAIDTVSKLLEISKTMQNVELKSSIADLANELADVNLQMADLKNEIAALQEENRTLKKNKEGPKPAVRWGCYQFVGDNNLYCPACYDTKGKKHLTTRATSKKRICSVCQTPLGT
jgi:FtsZ-binding cell division protein ZapB